MKKYGFTLAEVLITLSILGIVAAITIPTAIYNSKDQRNRVKIRKALSVYERLVNTAIAEDQIGSEAALNRWANDDSLCTNGRKSFKVSEFDAERPCIFKTADGLWWNIRNLDKTIVAFEKENTNQYNGISRFGYNAFIFVTEFDNSGAIRINDLGYSSNAKSPQYITSVEKVQKFLNKEHTDMLNNSMQDKYSEVCNMEKRNGSSYPSNPPCRKVADNGKTVTIYLSESGISNTGYNRVVLGDCDNGENCKSVNSVIEWIDNGDGTYRQFLSNGKNGRMNLIRDWKKMGSYPFQYNSIIKNQKCSDRNFSSCSTCTNYPNGSSGSTKTECGAGEDNWW